jgi:hypothetical protein
MSISKFLKNIFSRHNYDVQPNVIIQNESAENPVVEIVAGNKRLLLSTSQARSLWGKLGHNIEKMTPDPKEYKK